MVACTLALARLPPAQLIGGAGVVAQIDRRFLGFYEELADTTDAEAVVRRFGAALDADLVLADDLAVLLGIAVSVGDVPAQQLKQGIDEVGTCVGFIIRDTLVLLQVFLEAVDQLDQFVRQILHEASSFSIVHKTRDMQPGTDLRASQPSSRLAKTSPPRYICNGGYDLRCDAATIRRADGSGDRVPIHHWIKKGRRRAR